jgi:hypothetical protein
MQCRIAYRLFCKTVTPGEAKTRMPEAALPESEIFSGAKMSSMATFALTFPLAP